MLQELTQEIENTARAVLGDIHTALPGRIVSFDAVNNVAVIQPAGKFVTSDRQELNYPQITEVPVVFPFCPSAGVGLAFPLRTGDSCIVIISEVELDAWRNGAESEGSLRFDLTSAMAIPGLLESGSRNDLVKKAAELDALVLGASGTEVVVSGAGVRVDTGAVQFEVSDSGIAIGGNLTVEGNISYTGSCQQVK